MLGALCLLVTLLLYFFNKHLYRRVHHLPLMPLIFTPAVLVLLLVLTHISYPHYMGEARWL